ncbi:MAG TPA: type II secretion system protein [Longimicrobiales bacterium]
MAAVPGVRRGMTLVELLIVMLLFSIVLTAALGALRGESGAFSAGTRKMDLLQNYRYAANVLEKDLRTAGAGVPATQPFLVYAAEDAIAFNADYATNDLDDVFAVYADTSAPDALVSALSRDRRIVIPRSTFGYPDTSYMDAGRNSPAETIVFFFAPDTTTAASDDHALYRQVNDAEPEVVARNLRRSGDAPFFEYLRLRTGGGAEPRIEPVSEGALPLEHTVPIHLSVGDTGRLAVIDSIRAVRVRFDATNGRTGDDARSVTVSRLVRLPNAGLATLQTCGAPPLLGTTLDARVTTGASGAPAVELTWVAATDETGGEGDVVRYVLWRRPAGAVEWGDPIVSIPAGNSPYLYVDTRVEPGVYEYAVAAQDCTPTLSGVAVSPSVQVVP